MSMRAAFGRSVNAERRIRRTARRAGAPTLLAALGLWACGCPSMGPPDDDVAVLVPENYRSTFVQVRDCRNSSAHPSTVRVWVNSLGAGAYIANDNPMPVGSIVVKEEFAGTDCSDDAELILWSVMRKEPAGYNATGHDWHFQEVTAPQRTISRDGNATCIACHTASECLVRDLMCTEP